LRDKKKEDPMGPQYTGEMVSTEQRLPRDWARLILKLRWIGLDEEAKHLESAVATVRPEERCGTVCGLLSTD
jgi:hypothetical protein